MQQYICRAVLVFHSPPFFLSDVPADLVGASLAWLALLAAGSLK
jgi:hypothetical protein